MKSINITFDRVWPGHPINISAGETVSVDRMDGLALLVLEGGAWVGIQAPHTAAVDCLVRLDCIACGETPTTVTLEISR